MIGGIKLYDYTKNRHNWFPINRCHQRVVTSGLYGIIREDTFEFPVNKCHQRVMTLDKATAEQCKTHAWVSNQ